MKVKELISHLKQFNENLDVVYAIDEEGNAFHPIVYAPTLGYWDKKYNEFYTLNEETKLDDCKSPNAVCIN